MNNHMITEILVTSEKNEATQLTNFRLEFSPYSGFSCFLFHCICIQNSMKHQGYKRKMIQVESISKKKRVTVM